MQVDHTLTNLQVSCSRVLLVGNVVLNLAAAGAAVQNLKTQIAAVESLIAIDLDNRRNELVALNLVGPDSQSDIPSGSLCETPVLNQRICGIQAKADSSACRLF